LSVGSCRIRLYAASYSCETAIARYISPATVVGADTTFRDFPSRDAPSVGKRSTPRQQTNESCRSADPLIRSFTVAALIGLYLPKARARIDRSTPIGY